MTSKGWKLTAIALMAIVIAAGIGYWVSIARMPSQAATYATQQTSPMSSSQTVVQSWAER